MRAAGTLWKAFCKVNFTGGIQWHVFMDASMWTAWYGCTLEISIVRWITKPNDKGSRNVQKRSETFFNELKRKYKIKKE